MTISLEEIFNKTAVDAHTVFPHALEKLVILLVPNSDTPVYVSPGVANQLTKNTAIMKRVVEILTDKMRARDCVGMAGRNWQLYGTHIDLIALDKENERGAFSDRYTKNMRLILTLNHEIGHLILKNGHPSSEVSAQLAESAATAYAMLLHIQLFGKDTDHAGDYAGTRAFLMVALSDTTHYVADTVEKVFQLAEDTDISDLSLLETAALADKIATECRMDDKILEKIRNAYLPVNEACKIQIGNDEEITKKFYSEDKEAYALFCRETVAVMKSHPYDPDILKAGKRFLNYPAIKNFLMESVKTDSCWKQALSFLNTPATGTPTISPGRTLSPSI
jgi:hypothetical protein